MSKSICFAKLEEEGFSEYELKKFQNCFEHFDVIPIHIGYIGTYAMYGGDIPYLAKFVLSDDSYKQYIKDVKHELAEHLPQWIRDKDMEPVGSIFKGGMNKILRDHNKDRFIELSTEEITNDEIWESCRRSYMCEQYNQFEWDCRKKFEEILIKTQLFIKYALAE